MNAMKMLRLGAMLLCCVVVSAQEGGASRYEIPATDEGLPGTGPIRRYDWFKKLWKDKRTGWASRVEQDKGALVFLGDLITKG